MSNSTKYSVRVSGSPSKDPHPPAEGQKPEHWADEQGTAFQNPWDSWRLNTLKDKLGLFSSMASFPTAPKDVQNKILLQKPNWGTQSIPEGADWEASQMIKTTWLGHACFLVEFPSRMERPSSEEVRGLRILFDPVFSERCSPSQLVGPKRFTPPPCKIQEIPEIDAVVISHNHYDHLDTHTLKALLARSPSRIPHFFAPLGNGPYFKSIGVPTTHTHIMDWWESKQVVIDMNDDKNASSVHTVEITCTPGQHFTGRTFWDEYKTLWAGWAVVEVLGPALPLKHDENQASARDAVKVFFAGDTGYRAVMDGQKEEDVPVCPAFKTIGDRFGGFDCALIPIGAYLPRQYMSPIHCAPQDSVLLFQDIKAKKALGMHWATWVLTSEDIFEPPKRLAEECKKLGIADDAFTVCDIGETRFF
ncbi:N-acyl-phosphatidylethanolamine-hydrolyzing phospholipase D [Crassisporium funariophilum]|nr:N-acyl-phosphatidylethanolamine-hydrolyzing phospholipase D [Crassisporium funariophilum]